MTKFDNFVFKYAFLLKSIQQSNFKSKLLVGLCSQHLITSADSCLGTFSILYGGNNDVSPPEVK